MKALDEKSQVADVAERWYRQNTYGKGQWNKLNLMNGKTAHQVYAELFSLSKNASHKDVDDIIGVRGWAGPETCHCCRAVSFDMVQVGEELDYESATANVCRKCLLKALALLP